MGATGVATAEDSGATPAPTSSPVRARTDKAFRLRARFPDEGGTSAAWSDFSDMIPP
jgi:hypothetical protein